MWLIGFLFFSFVLVLVFFTLAYAYSRFVRSPLTIVWYLPYPCYIFQGGGEVRVLRGPDQKGRWKRGRIVKYLSIILVVGKEIYLCSTDTSLSSSPR